MEAERIGRHDFNVIPPEDAADAAVVPTPRDLTSKLKGVRQAPTLVHDSFQCKRFL